MSALLAYKNRPEGEPVPVQTNWSLVASNDNEPEVAADMGHERIIRMTPSVDEIMRQVATGDVEREPPSEMEITKGGVTKTVTVPGAIIRIGRLRFSNGEQVERGYKLGPDGGAVGAEIRMETGAMLGVRDTQDRSAGGDIDAAETTASNSYFNEMFGVAPRRRVSARKGKRRNGIGLGHAQAKVALAVAYANTPKLPPVTKCPPGLPAAGGRIADSFVGMRKAGKGDTGAMAWESIATALVDREIWAQALDELSERDRQTLDAVAHGRARTLKDVAGKEMSKRGAEYRGMRLLREANDNLQEKLKKFA